MHCFKHTTKYGPKYIDTHTYMYTYIETHDTHMSEDLPRLQASHSIFDISDPLPVQYTISVNVSEAALANVKTNKATGPDKIPRGL